MFYFFSASHKISVSAQSPATVHCVWTVLFNYSLFVMQSRLTRRSAATMIQSRLVVTGQNKWIWEQRRWLFADLLSAEECRCKEKNNKFDRSKEYPLQLFIQKVYWRRTTGVPLQWLKFCIPLPIDGWLTTAAAIVSGNPTREVIASCKKWESEEAKHFLPEKAQFVFDSGCLSAALVSFDALHELMAPRP